MGKDQAEWYKPKVAALQEFTDEVSKWIAGAPVSNVSEQNIGRSKDVTPQDSISNIKSVHTQRSWRSSQGSHRSSRPSKSSVASAKLKLESRKAELMARAARLAQKQALEKEEAILKAKKEQLELETEMAANTAKLEVIKGYESPHPGILQCGDGMNDYFENGLLGDPYNEMSMVYAPQTEPLHVSPTLEPERHQPIVGGTVSLHANGF